MKYINRSNVVEPPVAIGPTPLANTEKDYYQPNFVAVTKPEVKKKTKPAPTYYWYQVPIMRNPDGLVYTKTIDKPGHKDSISNEPNFVRWEPATQGVL